MSELVKLSAGRDRLEQELGSHLAGIAADIARQRYGGNCDVSRRGLQKAAIEAARDERCRLTLSTAPTPTSAVAVHLVDRLKAGSLTLEQVTFDESGSVWSDGARFTAFHRPDLVSGRAGQIAAERRDSERSEIVTLTAKNPAAGEFEALVQEEACRRGLLRPTMSSSDEDKAAWRKLIEYVAGRNRELAMKAQGRKIGSDGRVDGFVRGYGSPSLRVLEFDRNGRLIRSPAA